MDIHRIILKHLVAPVRQSHMKQQDHCEEQEDIWNEIWCREPLIQQAVTLALDSVSGRSWLDPFRPTARLNHYQLAFPLISQKHQSCFMTLFIVSMYSTETKPNPQSLMCTKSVHSTWLTTLLCAISCRMLGVTRLQNSRAVRIAVKLNSFWFWTVGATAVCSQYTVQSWANINAWKREHMCRTDVCRNRK